MADEKNTSGEGFEDVDEENVVTMVDVLKAEEIMEENADAVLGPGDDKNCTYSEGYLKRQALYSCLTCLPVEGEARAGICLACSYHCHSDHDLVELYTKRNFRCDCGTSIFKDLQCKLDPIKSGLNEKNLYNKNFEGLYCSCNRPYPDPENKDEDAMIQCFVCEDWFHTKHLGSSVPKEDEYAEMICGSCNDKLPFLQYYLGYSVSKIISSSEEKNDIVVDSNVCKEEKLLNTSQEKIKECVSSSDDQAKDQTEIIDKENKEVDCGKENTNHDNKETLPKDFENKENVANDLLEKDKKSEEESKPVLTSSNGVDSGSKKEDQKDCLLSKLTMLPRGNGATFWPENLRTLFCTCTSCLEMYKEKGVPFITDEEDTVSAYEEKGKTRVAQGTPTRYERGMEALNSLDRVQQMEAILSYNEMKSHLSEYLAKFVENKKVVREEDIREFFSGMQARKRQKLDIPHSCR